MTTNTTAQATRLDAYHFYENDWTDYDHLRDGFEWEIPEKVNMASYLCDRWADDDGDRIALYAENEAGEERSYTFEELQSVANRLANFLRDRGVERGDRVGVNAPQKPETVFAHVAAWKLGTVSVPLSTLFGPDALGYRLDDSDAVACVVDESNLDALREVRDDCPALETVVTVDGDPEGDEVEFWDAVDGPSAAFETVDTDAEDDAIIIYTSGTTGDPKGVRHAHRVILGHLPLVSHHLLQHGTRRPDDTFWTPSEWAWVASLFDVVFPGLYYGKPVLAYAGGPFDAEKAFELVEKYGVTNFFAPATALRMMMQVDSAEYDVADLRVIASGGESLGQSIVEWAEDVFAGAAVHEGYGQTEANLTIGDCTALTEFREGTMGRAAPGMEITIVDPETAEPTVETGEVGEIAVHYEGNPVCFKEYWRKPERTRKKGPKRLAAHRGPRLDGFGWVRRVREPEGRRHHLVGLPHRSRGGRGEPRGPPGGRGRGGDRRPRRRTRRDTEGVRGLRGGPRGLARSRDGDPDPRQGAPRGLRVPSRDSSSLRNSRRPRPGRYAGPASGTRMASGPKRPPKSRYSQL